MKRTLFLFMVGLLAFTAAQAQEFTTEDSGSIAVGDNVTGEFEAGVRDRYTLELGDDQTVVNIYLDGDVDLDTYLRVYNEGEDEPFAENDDRGDGTLFSTLGLEGVSGTLIIEVGTFGDESAGSYSLRVAPPATIEDVGEIALGDAVEGTLPENTRQLYTLTVDETTALHIALEGDDLDTFLWLYAEGEATASVQNDDIDADNISAGWASLVVPGGTSLVIEAGTYGDAGAGDYTLTVEEADVTLPATEAPVEFGEDSTTADICEGADEAETPTRLQYYTPEEVLEADIDYGAVFCTEAGNFRIDLYEDEAPITVNSFVFLASNHYFDRSTFHRVIQDFVVQGGDPTGTGFGGPGYEYINETDNDLTFDGIGVVGMANAGPDTNGSQFFITLGPVGRLDGGYTIFGQVLQGIAAVTDIEIRDPGSATEPGTEIYTVVIVTIPPEEPA
jgi:cyclophilin family peptidyl-prolyl cis-trans isomerase